MRPVSLLIALALCVCPTAAGLEVPIEVHETAGAREVAFPVTAIVPLPYGVYQDTRGFDLGVPAQFEVLNRWWMRDGSIRHLMVHLQAELKGGGKRTFTLRDGGGKARQTPLRVDETETGYTVTTGPLRFDVSRERFNLLDQVWFDRDGNGEYAASEQVIDNGEPHGGRFVGGLEPQEQPDSTLGKPTLVLEEDGPLRVVIRAELPAVYNGAEDHRHGYAVRIYAYAGLPYIKVDYQLQNSAGNQRYAGPLYVDRLDLDYRLTLGAKPTVRIGRGAGAVHTGGSGEPLALRQEMHDRFTVRDGEGEVKTAGEIPDGYLDVSDGKRGVTAMTRNFWQTWPNGLAYDGETLHLELFPQWGEQFHDGDDEDRAAEPSPTGRYWLEDMQHVLKETLLFFHDGSASDKELAGLAATFQAHPVPVLPVSWYAETRATLDLDGVVPIDSHKPANPRRTTFGKKDYDTRNKYRYRFGWDAYGIDIKRKWGVSQGGGWPASEEYFAATGHPNDYFAAERAALGELNVRPQWMAGYDFARDWDTLGLTQAPYAGGTWRAQGDKPGYLPGTSKDAKARDDQHGWFYFVEEAYHYSGNPWIRDWYTFIKEFRRSRLTQSEPSPDRSSRGTGHAVAHALAAYRATGDREMFQQLTAYLRDYLYPTQNDRCGQRIDHKNRDTVFMTGYLLRALLDYMHEIEGPDGDPQAYAEAWNFVSGIFEWNYHTAGFGGTLRPCAPGTSDDTAHTFVDPQAWYYARTGQERFLEQLEDYIDGGIDGGQAPVRRAKFGDWYGQYHGRYYQHVKQQKRKDREPPKRIEDARVVCGEGGFVLSWTAPADAERYHIVWSDRPISEQMTEDPLQVNWWAARALGADLAPAAGKPLQVAIPVEGGTTVFAAVFSFDATGNMSGMSNLARLSSDSE